MSLSFILLIFLILLLIGALPSWGYSRSWGYGPSGGLGLVLVSVLVRSASRVATGIPANGTTTASKLDRRFKSSGVGVPLTRICALSETCSPKVTEATPSKSFWKASCQSGCWQI